MPDKILLVDDEKELLTVLKKSLTRQGYKVYTAENGEEGWNALVETMFDLVISDQAMQPVDGLELLQRIRSIDHHQPFIIMTGAGSIESAVEAMRMGAFTYITKPFKTQELALLAGRAIEYGKLHRRLEDYDSREKQNATAGMVVGNNPVIKQMLSTIKKVADSEASILIQGETGTGKSMFAKHIHKISARKDKPFFTIDCGALSEHLLESELFGHVKGAFTGAVRAKRGLLEEAQGGTIFLDEIGELTPSTQVKLLRAIQEKEIKPVGGNIPIHIDVRFISATSRNLSEEVEKNGFRKDLYYRLAVIPLHLPALRERKEDLGFFVDHFIRKCNKMYNKKVTELDPAAMQVLMNSSWKGNIRELENIIERAVLLTDDTVIAVDSLYHYVRPSTPPVASEIDTSSSLKEAVEQAERAAIRKALKEAAGNRSKAARVLGISRRTLYDKLELYDFNSRETPSTA
ncbi:sigma-54-dependent transcriptional regulator [Desulfoplanes formicivorans]|uniref:Sigma-54-dependent Fis family transcriptional regulator n=1 Tax=Desulfoplanes formicivorans TaxID=1592317 RepID=A0A194AKC3_9BACT|nr:sigma-54 dependent transcriptional regulator [Desulfoplanes formicivorans]GAU09506.1 sigma-54-dependent Fis family transcriptional regulator [Desulfoplanes formicivorans]